MRNIAMLIVPFFLLGGIFYSIRRRSKIFWGDLSYKSILFITLAVLLFIVAIFFCMRGDILGFSSKTLDIIGSIGMRITTLLLLSIPFLLLEHLISKRYQIPRYYTIAVILTIFGFGFYNTQNTIITTINIESNKIQQDTKILFVSDTHVNNIFHTKHLETIKKEIKNQNPDFVVIAGDLLDGVKSEYVPAFTTLQNIGVPIYATLGNHDSMGEVHISEEIGNISDVQILRNESVEESWLQIIGIDDRSIRNWKSLEEILAKSNIQDEGKFTIFVTHQPIALSKLTQYPIDLQLAGHTHKGQNIFVMPLAITMNDYFYGRYDEGDRTAIVSQGIGTRGLPFRLGSQSEIMIINLQKK